MLATRVRRELQSSADAAIRLEVLASIVFTIVVDHYPLFEFPCFKINVHHDYNVCTIIIKAILCSFDLHRGISTRSAFIMLVVARLKPVQLSVSEGE